MQTHKERVEGLNRYLSALSEHHDMYASQASVLDVCGALTVVKAEDWAWIILDTWEWQAVAVAVPVAFRLDWIGWGPGVEFGAYGSRRYRWLCRYTIEYTAYMWISKESVWIPADMETSQENTSLVGY